jgi:hypothetical protein
MTDDQLLGHPLDPLRIAGKRFHGVGHSSSLRDHSNGVITIASKCVTLSGLAQSDFSRRNEGAVPNRE